MSASNFNKFAQGNQAMNLAEKLNLNSHHNGFGTLEIDRFVKTPQDCATTGRQPSNKFKEKLIVKQRQAEELIIANRIKKLHNEEERLVKQIAIANKHTHQAEEIKQRRLEEIKVQQEQKEYYEKVRKYQYSINCQRREANKTIISFNQTLQQREKVVICDQIKEVSKNHDGAIVKIKRAEEEKLRIKNQIAYDQRRTVLDKMQYDKELYLDSVARVHQQQAIETIKVQQKHVGQLQRLEEIEKQKVEQLATTVAANKAALQILSMTSPGLKRTMQPRKAYHFKSRVDLETRNGVVDPLKTAPNFCAASNPQLMQLQAELLETRSGKPQSSGVSFAMDKSATPRVISNLQSKKNSAVEQSYSFHVYSPSLNKQLPPQVERKRPQQSDLGNPIKHNLMA